MYVSSMYDEIKCLTCGVYRERSEGEANPPQKLMVFSLLFRVTRFFELCVHNGVCMLFCSDTPLVLNPLVVVVAEVDRD